MTRHHNIPLDEVEANSFFSPLVRGSCPSCGDRDMHHEDEPCEYYLVECDSCGDEFMFDYDYMKENYPEVVPGKYELVEVEYGGKTYQRYVLINRKAED